VRKEHFFSTFPLYINRIGSGTCAKRTLFFPTLPFHHAHCTIAQKDLAQARVRKNTVLSHPALPPYTVRFGSGLRKNTVLFYPTLLPLLEIFFFSSFPPRPSTIKLNLAPIRVRKEIFFSTAPFYHKTKSGSGTCVKRTLFFSTPPFHHQTKFGSGTCAKRTLFFSTPPPNRIQTFGI
jgi:hypothetical protein